MHLIIFIWIWRLSLRLVAVIMPDWPVDTQRCKFKFSPYMFLYYFYKIKFINFWILCFHAYKPKYTYDDIQAAFRSDLSVWVRWFFSKRKRMRSENYNEVDDCHFKWFTNTRSSNIAISGEMLRNLKNSQWKLGVSDFKCSSGFIDRLKKTTRNCI